MKDFRFLERRIKGVVGGITCLSLLFSVQWSRVLAQEVGVNALASGKAIEETCGTRANENGSLANRQFQDECQSITQLGDTVGDEPALVESFNALAADQVSAQNSASVRRNDTNISVIGHRMELLRVSGGVSVYKPGESIAQNLLFNEALGGGASADSEYGKLGLFFSGRFLTGDEDADTLQDGFDFDGGDLMAGVDYRFSDHLVAGVALSYAEGDIDYDNNRGSLDTDAWGVVTYASYFLESGLFFEGQMSYTSLDYSMDRHVFYTTISGDISDQQMKSSPDADVYSVSLGVGKSYNRKSWSFSPSLRFDYLENDVDSYTEKSSDFGSFGGAMALAVGSANYESLTSNLGIQIATARNVSSGVIVPQVRVDWVHEFEDDRVGVTAHYLNDINRTRFKIKTTSQDSDYFDVSVGLSAQFPHGRSGFISYRTSLGYDNLTYNSIQVGFRIELN